MLGKRIEIVVCFSGGEQWQSDFVAKQHSIGFHHFSLQPVFLKLPFKFKTIIPVGYFFFLTAKLLIK